MSVKSLRDGRKAAGLCIECGAPGLGFSRCATCRGKNAASVQKLKESGKKAPETPEKRSEWNRRSYVKKRGNEACVTCGKPNETNDAVCNNCKVKKNEGQRERRKLYTDAGLCRFCGKQAELSGRSLRGRERGSYCKRCWLKVLAMATLGSMKRWRELVAKLDACGWKCHYTKKPLVIGENLSFDHMNPVARFPEQKHDINNVVPCDWKVNLMKRDLTKEEFIALVQEVYQSNKE